MKSRSQKLTIILLFIRYSRTKKTFQSVQCAELTLIFCHNWLWNSNTQCLEASFQRPWNIVLLFFSQPLLQHIQNSGRKSRFLEAENLYQKIVRVAAFLPFLLAKDVIKRFEVLNYFNDNSGVTEFLEFFEKTYIGVFQEIGTDKRALKFAVSEWKVCQVVQHRKVKPRNKVEVWNKNFNSAVNVKYPNIPNIKSHFTDLQKHSELTVQRWMRVKMFRA